MKSFQNAIGVLTYTEYLTKFKNWVENLQSSHPDASAALVEFTRLNWVRTIRLEKTMRLDESLIQKAKRLTQKYSWLVITEAWCGDSAQNLPFIASLAKQVSENIDLYIVLRDENKDLMDSYLTNGARAIPKLIIINEVLNEEITQWGPRPSIAQKMVLEWKKEPGGRTWNDLEKELHTWYAKDKGMSIQQELDRVLDVLIEKEMVLLN